MMNMFLIIIIANVFLIFSCSNGTSNFDKINSNIADKININYEKSSILNLYGMDSNKNVEFVVKSPPINGYNVKVINIFKNKGILLSNPYFTNGNSSIIGQNIEFYYNGKLINTYQNNRKNSSGALEIFYTQFEVINFTKEMGYQFEGWQGSNGGLEDVKRFNFNSDSAEFENRDYSMVVDTTYNLYPIINSR